MNEETRSAGDGSALALKALGRLLGRAENAVAKKQVHPDKAARLVSLTLSEKSFPEYLRLQRHADKVECNASFQLAEREGAIHVEWDKRAGERTQVQRIVLRDENRLAQHLRVVPRWDFVAQGEHHFEPHLASHPMLAQVLSGWRKGNIVRGTRAGEVAHWLDAIQVLEHCAMNNGDDLPIRRLSARLFGDSKRIEAIWSTLDALVLGDLEQVQSEAEDLFAQLGLVKFPPTFLVAGRINVLYGDEIISASRPYVGLAPSEIHSVSLDASSIRYLLTVENLTTFHELANKRPDEAIVIYTGGMPSPSWKRAYGVFLQALPKMKPVHHWGDIDVGGFRIASHIAKCCADHERSLQLHGMRTDAMPPGAVSRRDLDSAARREILRICDCWQWNAEADAIGGFAVEQEAMEPFWPD